MEISGRRRGGSFFFLPDLYLPFEKKSAHGKFFLHGACAFLMLRIAFCIRKGSLLAKAMVMLYLTAFLAGGFWEAVSENGITLPAFLIFAFATYMGIGALVCAADSARSLRKNIYPVTLSYREKNSLLTGL